MKRIVQILLIISGIIIVGICIYFGIKHINTIKIQNKYGRMLDKIQEAVEWQNNAVYVIRDEDFCSRKNKSSTTSDHLIAQGYLKKEDMLDIDGKNYCDARIDKYIDNDCNIRYKIKLSCHDCSTVSSH